LRVLYIIDILAMSKKLQDTILINNLINLQKLENFNFEID